MTLRHLIFWARDNCLTSRPELFVQGDSVCVEMSMPLPSRLGGPALRALEKSGVTLTEHANHVVQLIYSCPFSLSRRPGILVLINDVDWELRWVEFCRGGCG